MSTQEVSFNGDQFASNNLQERTLEVGETGQRLDEIVPEESTAPVHIPHHSTCCCESCWTETIKSYI